MLAEKNQGIGEIPVPLSKTELNHPGKGDMSSVVQEQPSSELSDREITNLRGLTEQQCLKTSTHPTLPLAFSLFSSLLQYSTLFLCPC